MASTRAIPPLPRGAPLGVVAAHDPGGALGSWRSEARVAVAIPDNTRRMNLGAALEAVERRLPNMLVVVGLGLHRPMRPEELAPIARWRPVQHDPDDVVATCEVDGIPGEISRHVAEAPWSLSIGVVELHQYAGFSGGHKGVAVGCGGRATLAALHHRDRVVAPGVEVGRVEGNPVFIYHDIFNR